LAVGAFAVRADFAAGALGAAFAFAVAAAVGVAGAAFVFAALALAALVAVAAFAGLAALGNFAAAGSLAGAGLALLALAVAVTAPLPAFGRVLARAGSSRFAALDFGLSGRCDGLVLVRPSTFVSVAFESRFAIAILIPGSTIV
jgi:hypothetical protein